MSESPHIVDVTQPLAAWRSRSGEKISIHRLSDGGLSITVVAERDFFVNLRLNDALVVRDAFNCYLPEDTPA